ncbi:hypothetical protein [Streptomyces alboflavus]|uniref:hypothetical protein n=1 Tax=Streptomyces alboflavus TaxID=67267 RepID=UPI00367F94FD
MHAEKGVCTTTAAVLVTIDASRSRLADVEPDTTRHTVDMCTQCAAAALANPRVLSYVKMP